MASILTEIENLYHTRPRACVTSILATLLRNLLSAQQSLLDTFVILHAGFVASLYRLIGIDLVAHLVQTLVERFDVVYKAQAKEAISILVFLSELYNFGVVGPELIYDLIRMFLQNVNEYDTELLLKIIQSKVSLKCVVDETLGSSCDRTTHLR